VTAHSRQAGFSVIEALVAVAVVAIALASLIGLQADVSRTLIRQREFREQLGIQRDALAFFRDINIMERPRGVAIVGVDRRLSWHAAPTSRLVRSTQQGTGDGNFEIRLYRVDVEAIAAQGADPVQFSFEQVGWRRLETVASKQDKLLPSVGPRAADRSPS